MLPFGAGGEITVDSTPTKYNLVDAPTALENQKTAATMKMWNTGSSSVYVYINAETTDYAESTAAVIPAGESMWFIGQPMKKFVIACASGNTSSVSYGAY